MTLTISLDQLQLHAHHGVLEQERRVGGDFTVSVEMDVKGAEDAVWEDKLEATVNYADAYAAIRDEMRTPSRLIEHVAGRIAQRLRHDFPQIVRIRVKVVKVNPPMGAICAGAAVTVTL